VQRIRVAPGDVRAAALAPAVGVLRRGGIVAYATDTLYGLAVDPRSPEAVERLFAAKGRDARAAVPLIAATLEQAPLAALLTERDLRVARIFWPGPLSLVAPAHVSIAGAALGGGTTVAIRVPAHDVARALAAAFGFCITATSANPSGLPPACTADEVAAALAGHVDVLLDSGPAPGGPPSTIVDLRHEPPTLVRAGAIAWDRVLESLE
jgi:L-threonylcarbamoyladenylate synthase